MQILICTNAILNGNNEYTDQCIQLLIIQMLFRCVYCECQYSINIDKCTDLVMKGVQCPTLNGLVSVIGKKVNDTLIAPF
jgi:hypothetical protein